MKWPKECKVWRVVAKEPIRGYGIDNARLDVEKKCLVATQSFVAVRIPVEVQEGDTSGPITVGALKG